MSRTGSSGSSSSSHSTHSTHSTQSTHGTHTHSTQHTHSAHHTAKGAAARNRTPKLDLKHLPAGISAEMAAKVRSLGLTTVKALQPSGSPGTKNRRTHCNAAANSWAQKYGYKGFMNKKGEPMMANDMFKKMSAPGSGFRKVTAAEAITAAQQGKLTFASAMAPKHGHIAPVTGEWSPGVPGLSQAGASNFEFGAWQSRKETPTYFVKD